MSSSKLELCFLRRIFNKFMLLCFVLFPNAYVFKNCLLRALWQSLLTQWWLKHQKNQSPSKTRGWAKRTPVLGTVSDFPTQLPGSNFESWEEKGENIPWAHTTSQAPHMQGGLPWQSPPRSEVGILRISFWMGKRRFRKRFQIIFSRWSRMEPVAPRADSMPKPPVFVLLLASSPVLPLSSLEMLRVDRCWPRLNTGNAYVAEWHTRGWFASIFVGHCFAYLFVLSCLLLRNREPCFVT